MYWLNYFAFGVNTSHIYVFTFTKLLKCKTVIGKLAGRTLGTAVLDCACAHCKFKIKIAHFYSQQHLSTHQGNSGSSL